MGKLLIILLFVFIFWPLIKAIWRLFTQARRINKFMNDQSSFFTGFNGSGGGERHSTGQKQKHGKKFTRDMGEYVDFTDVACNVGDSSAKSPEMNNYRKEEQVTDIDWVDIEEEKK